MRVNSPNDSFCVSQGQINVLTKKSNYIPFIVSLVQGYCLLLSPIKPFSHCFLPKSTNERQRGTSKVRQDRAGSETPAGPGSSVIAQSDRNQGTCVHDTNAQPRHQRVPPQHQSGQVALHGPQGHTSLSPWASLSHCTACAAGPEPGCPTQTHIPSIPALKLLSA